MFLRWLDREQGETDASFDADLAAATDAARTQVHALIAAHRRAEGLLVDTKQTSAFNSPHGRARVAHAIAQESVVIPGYEIGRELGRGGFGVVYEARQTAPVQRMVAIKVLRSEFASPDVVRRFQAEARVLARMDHPGIARVTDAGTDSAGRPFVAMELVDGRPLLEYCRHNQLGVRDRVALMSELCKAVHHAHQRAVIHRDLKPLNVLVETRDGVPRPRVIDFGVAKLLDDALPDAVTRAGAMIGTPRYMSPEQARSAELHDIRIDVYALGVMLCEVISGLHPRASREGQPTPSDDSIHSRQATRPSTLIDQSDVQGPIRASDVRGDLDRIVMKAIALDPDDRYSSAAAMAQDLDRYLAGHPVLATQGGAAYVFRKLVFRHRVASAAIALAAVSLIVGTVASLLAMNRAEIARIEAERDRSRAEAVSEFLLGGMLDAANPDLQGGREYSLVTHLREASRETSRRFADDPRLQLRVLDHIARSQRSLTDFEAASVTFAKAADVAARQHGPASAPTLGYRLEAMLATLSTGRTDGQDVIAEDIRDIAVKSLGPDDPLSLRAALHAAHVSPSENAVADLQGVKSRIEALGLSKSALHLEALTLLGRAMSLDDPDASLGILKEASALATDLFGQSHTRSLEARFNLGSALRSNGDLTAADAIFGEVSTTAKQTHGELSVFNRVACEQRMMIAQSKGDTSLALSFARQVLEISQRTYLGANARTARAHHAVGVYLLELDRCGEAVEHLAECRRQRMQVVDASDPSIVFDAVFLASALSCAGRHAEADEILPDVRSLLPFGGVIRARGICTEADIARSAGDVSRAREIVSAELTALKSLSNPTAQSRAAEQLLQNWIAKQRN